ncbi:MAG: hypothetical protein ACRD8Z_10340 [Nitrososphaeraceae archaeon]
MLKEHDGHSVGDLLRIHSSGLQPQSTHTIRIWMLCARWFISLFSSVPESQRQPETDILNMSAPGSCARCKSKQWRLERVRKRMMPPITESKAAYRRAKTSGRISESIVKILDSIP